MIKLENDLQVSDLESGEIYYVEHLEYQQIGLIFRFNYFRYSKFTLMYYFSSIIKQLNNSRTSIHFDTYTGGYDLHNLRKATKQEIKQLEKAEEGYFYSEPELIETIFREI